MTSKQNEARDKTSWNSRQIIWKAGNDEIFGVAHFLSNIGNRNHFLKGENFPHSQVKSFDLEVLTLTNGTRETTLERGHKNQP